MTKPLSIKLSTTAVTVTIVPPSPNISPEDIVSFSPANKTGMIPYCCLFICFCIPPVTEKHQSAVELL